jgi:GAF domain-containing protein
MTTVDVTAARRLAGTVRSMALQESYELTLQSVARTALTVVPGCEHASVSLRHANDRVRTPAATDEVALLLDARQYQLDEGPCLDAVRNEPVVVTGDLGDDEAEGGRGRWSQWSRSAREAGVRSVLSVRVGTPGTVLGSLNLYADPPRAYDRDAVALARLFADHAATATALSNELVGLRSALATRHTIGLAQGVLMQRYSLDVDAAFAVLQRHSQDTNTKLRDLATAVVEGRDVI